MQLHSRCMGLHARKRGCMEGRGTACKEEGLHARKRDCMQGREVVATLLFVITSCKAQEICMSSKCLHALCFHLPTPSHILLHHPAPSHHPHHPTSSYTIPHHPHHPTSSCIILHHLASSHDRSYPIIKLYLSCCTDKAYHK